ncbi:MAG: hypothetical protein ACYDA9_20840 [Terriglobia bacterium]
MSKRKTERLLEEIRRIAAQLEEGDESLSRDELRNHLREAGVDPDELKARFHRMAKLMAERERLADRRVPLALEQAIDATRPEDQMPTDPTSARIFADRWLDRFSSAFVVPSNLEAVRAYRKTGDVSKLDQEELDRLEQELKEKVKKEDEAKT